MRLFQRDIIPISATLLAVVGSFLAYDHLPSRIPVHWGMDGRVDGELRKDIGAYLLPGAMALVYVFFRLIPYADKRRVRQLKEIGLYDRFRNGAVLLFGYAHLLSLGIGLGWFSGQANFLIGAISLLILILADCIHAGEPPALARVADSLAPARVTRGRLAAWLAVAGACGIVGTFTGTAQGGWLVATLAVGYLVVRWRRPCEETPDS
ncbi:MAG: DUF1648 domain-containing protein [Candidatus Latescibacteria bacterium]|jgi:hypothetical protein|nr:DUF1648 domain-containing protein [Candidatus Latescibacterota bacterium]